jgi:hypothetical protein
MGALGAAVVFAHVLATAPAHAETTFEVLQRFGFTGSWAYSCKDPPGVNNLWLTVYRDTDGKVKRRLDRGGDPPLVSVIEDAEILSPTTLRLRFRNDGADWGHMNGMVFDVVEVLENNGLRVLSSKDAAGTDFIKDGINLTARQPTPFTYRCKD